jgi:hypothetical protein
VTYDSASVLLVPVDQPWTATFNAPRGARFDHEVYIDITTPPMWLDDDAVVTMVDLDLDVLRRWDGRVEVADEDEFAAHRVELG